MPTIDVEVTGARKWLAGLIEDSVGTVFPLTFNGDQASATIQGGGVAILSIHFYGAPRGSLKTVVKKGSKVLETRNYKIDPDGSGGRAIPFDPDA